MRDGKRDLLVCMGMLATVVAVSAGVFGLPGHRHAMSAAVHGSSDGLPDDLSRMPPTAAGPQAAPAPVPVPSLVATQLAARLSSPRPVDAYIVYKLLASCANARERAPGSGFQGGHVDRGAIDDCEGVDDALVARRVEWLSSAADAGVHGAVADLLAQGPQGQPLATVWHDPRYAAWREQVVGRAAQAAARGDRDALATLARLYADGSLPDQGADALKYQVAWIDVAAAANPTLAQPAQRARYLEDALVSVEHYGGQLTPAERAAAIAAGHALGTACCGT